MSSGLKPFTITKKQAMEAMPPKLVERMLYAHRNHPEMGWLEILPREPGKEVRETYIVYESLERAFSRIRCGEFPPDMPADRRYREKRAKKKNCFDSNGCTHSPGSTLPQPRS
jgi:hypothetical protein